VNRCITLDTWKMMSGNTQATSRRVNFKDSGFYSTKIQCIPAILSIILRKGSVYMSGQMHPS